MNHRDIALQNIQTLVDEATETMHQIQKTHDFDPAQSQINEMRRVLDHTEEVLQTSYVFTQKLLAEGKVTQLDLTQLQQIIHQVSTTRYQMDHR